MPLSTLLAHLPGRWGLSAVSCKLHYPLLETPDNQVS